MKLGGAVMGRNEIDIIGTFLRHLDTLFDYVLVMDHGLLDGTDRIIAEACARRPGRTVWRVEAVSYHQSEFSTFALRHLLQATDADCVVLLDADEFIDTLDRASFEAALAAAADPDCVGVLHWLNAVPCRFDSRAIDPGEAIWVAKAPGPLGKVAISRAFCDRHGNEGRLGVGEPCARV